VTIHSLHNNLKCCHLDLNLSNIMVVNGDFTFDKEHGLYTVNPNIQIKLVDFGLSEMFKVDEAANDNFSCNKFGITDKFHLSAPKVFREELYDARKADIWSVGIILYELATGIEPYKFQSVKDQRFHMLKHGKLGELAAIKGKTNYINQKMLKLMVNMLSFREHERFDSNDVLKDEWLSLYYNKYVRQINKKSELQKLREQQLRKKENMCFFPYYAV